MAERRLRVLVGKPGLDGHDKGARAIALAFRDAGFEVLLAGMARADEIAHIASEEDVDLVGLNVGGRIEVVERIIEELRKVHPEAPVFAGGTISPEAVKRLRKLGVECFPPGSSLADIARAAARLCGVK